MTEHPEHAPRYRLGWHNVGLAVAFTPFHWSLDLEAEDNTLFVFLGPVTFSVSWYD